MQKSYECDATFAVVPGLGPVVDLFYGCRLQHLSKTALPQIHNKAVALSSELLGEFEFRPILAAEV